MRREGGANSRVVMLPHAMNTTTARAALQVGQVRIHARGGRGLLPHGIRGVRRGWT